MVQRQLVQTKVMVEHLEHGRGTSIHRGRHAPPPNALDACTAVFQACSIRRNSQKILAELVQNSAKIVEKQRFFAKKSKKSKRFDDFSLEF